MGYRQLAEAEEIRREREENREANRQRALKQLGEVSNVGSALRFLSDDDAATEIEFHLNAYQRPNGQCFVLHRAGPTRFARLEDGRVSWTIPATMARTIVSTECFTYHTRAKCKG